MDQHEHGCRYCEKFILELEEHKDVDTLLELPNTYNPMTRRYEWRDRGVMAYALIPQALHEHHGSVDVYVCVDEDDMDDLDLAEYTKSFLTHDVLPSWGNYKDIRLTGPSLAPPPAIGCWRRKHEEADAEHA